MLAERVKEWTRDWREEGFKEGEKAGWEKGEKAGEFKLLTRLLEKRFGAPLPEWTSNKLSSASSEQLEIWGERILEADSLEELFK